MSYGNYREKYPIEKGEILSNGACRFNTKKQKIQRWL